MKILRKWAFLKEPFYCNKKDIVYKIMIHQTKREGTYVYLYCSPDAERCSFDEWYPDLEDALENWEDQVAEWHEIGAPAADAHDRIDPA